MKSVFRKTSKTVLKSISGYFFEFIMLFLAITLGFLVENQRDNLNERDQERKLMKTLAEDLVTDIKRIDLILQLRSERIRWNDSLILLLNSPKPTMYSRSIYQFALSASSKGTLFYKSNSMQFLTNEGFYKISSPLTSTETREYNLRIEDLLNAQEGAVRISTQLNPLVYRLLSAKSLIGYDKGDNTTEFTLNLSDSGFINELCNTVRHVNGNIKAQIKFEERLKDQANRLLQTISKEYDILVQ